MYKKEEPIGVYTDANATTNEADVRFKELRAGEAQQLTTARK